MFALDRRRIPRLRRITEENDKDLSPTKQQQHHQPPPKTLFTTVADCETFFQKSHHSNRPIRRKSREDEQAEVQLALSAHDDLMRASPNDRTPATAPTIRKQVARSGPVVPRTSLCEQREAAPGASQGHRSVAFRRPPPAKV